MRGENRLIVWSRKWSPGTSPRARGKPGEGLGFGGALRNIPACAGKTRFRMLRRSCNQEHPRVRGENPAIASANQSNDGTSPRARGKPGLITTAYFASRNIPACAGKTPRGLLIRCRVTEHPRVRGENKMQPKADAYDCGTSPRARGKRKKHCPETSKERNIPACAGKTSCGNLRFRLGKEHPRVRGENINYSLAASSKAGTSPRARGKPEPP